MKMGWISPEDEGRRRAPVVKNVPMNYKISHYNDYFSL
jgi:hypothetical protein